MKRKITIGVLISITLCAILALLAYAASPVNVKFVNGTLEFYTTDIAATTGTKYVTTGWTVTQNPTYGNPLSGGTGTYGKMNNEQVSQSPNPPIPGQQVTTYFQVPETAVNTALIQAGLGQITDGTTVYLNAIFQVEQNGSLLPTKYYTEDAIKNAEPWSDPSVFDQYYDIKKAFQSADYNVNVIYETQNGNTLSTNTIGQYKSGVTVSVPLDSTYQDSSGNMYQLEESYIQTIGTSQQNYLEGPSYTTRNIIQSVGGTNVVAIYKKASSPSITLSASPTSLQTGQSSTLTATAQNMPSTDHVVIYDQSNKDTLSGGNQVQGTTATATDSNAETVNYIAEIVDGSGNIVITSNQVQVTWSQSGGTGGGGTGGSSSLTLTANPTSLSTGQSTTLTASDPNMPSGAYILIQDMSSANTIYGVTNTHAGSVGQSTVTATATSNTAQTVQYQASETNPNTGQTITSQMVSVTWGGTTSNGSVSVTIQPQQNETVNSGQYVTVSYTTSGFQSGDIVAIQSSRGGQPTTYTTSSDQFMVKQSPTNGASVTLQYTATLEDSSGNPLATSTSGTITWGSQPPPPPPPPAPTIDLSASITNVSSGNSTYLYYSAKNLQSGYTVKIVGTGTAANLWNQSGLTSSSGGHSETESPINGNSVSATYTAYVLDANGTILAQSSQVTVTWTSVKPTITMSANPTTNVPGQPATIAYQVSPNLPTGDYVNVVGTGGLNEWNATNLTSAQSTKTETEHPSAGQTITVNYTSIVYDSKGNVLASASTSVKWVNAWPAGATIGLSGNPLNLTAGNPTTLTATTSVPVPNGYKLIIRNQSTGQDIGVSSTSPEAANYTAYTAASELFQAYITDGYDTLGTSNNVTVNWMSLSLSANPLSTPINTATTLTATASNMPSGENLYIYDQSTLQVVGETSNNTLTITQTKSTPQTDIYFAFINTSGTPDLAVSLSNAVPVNWYSLTLTANPTHLPVSTTSTITATAKNIPSGYVLQIVNETTNKVIASGQTGQTTVQALENYSTVQTDKYIAQIVQPNNPSIPGLTIPASGPQVYTLQPSDVTFRGNDTSQILPVSQDGGTFNESTPYNVWTNLNTGDYGEHYYNAGKQISYVSFSLADNMYGVSGSTFYSNPYIKAYNSSGTQIGIYNITVPFDGGGYQNLSWVPPSGTTALAFGWIYNSGWNSADNWQAAWSNVQVTFGTFNTSVYVGTNGRGVGYWNGSTWTNIGFPNGSASISQNGLAYDPVHNEVWQGAQGSGAAYWNGSTWTNAGDPNGSGIVNGFAFDSNTKQMWAATDNGVAYWNGSSWTNVGYPNGALTVDSLAYDSQDNVMFASDASGIAYWNGSSWVTAAFNSYGNGPIYYSASNNRIYAGGGYYIGYETGTSLSWTQDNTMTGITESITGTSTGNIFKGSLNNYNLYEWQSGNSDSQNVGYLGSDGQSMSVDLQGNIWIASQSSGVEKYSGGSVSTIASTVNGTNQMQAIVAVNSTGSTGTQYFPYWSFQSLPSYIPSNLFNQPTYQNGSGFWAQSGSTVPNGTAFYQSTFNLPSAGPVGLSIPALDDAEQIFIDGKPVLQYGNLSNYSPGVPSGSSTAVTLPAGMHQVVIEGTNNDGFGSAGNNPAVASLQITDGSGNVLVSSNAANWSSTGYVTSLPSGWFSGAIGTYNFTEYVLQTGTSNPIYNQASYTVTTSAANVALQSNEESVTWYNPIVPPDNFTLQAVPTSVIVPNPTTFMVTLTTLDANWVNQQEGGQAYVGIFNTETMKQVANILWKPANGMTASTTYVPPGGTTLTYIAFLEDTKGLPLADTNTVQVTATGTSQTSSTYTTTSCGPNGSEILSTYTNGKLTSQKTVPLTLTNLEVDGLFNPPQMQKDYPNGMTLPLPNTADGNPVYVRAQTPFDIAVKFPDAQPTKVTATFRANEGDTVDQNGDTTWTIDLKPDPNHPYFWHGASIMPKLPIGENISVEIDAHDDCGDNLLDNINFLQVEGRPQWYFTNQVSP